jgi:hypothetical protein
MQSVTLEKIRELQTGQRPRIFVRRSSCARLPACGLWIAFVSILSRLLKRLVVEKLGA